MAYARNLIREGCHDRHRPARLPLDPLMVVMTLGFAVAVAALAWPAFRASPMSTPGMILLVTVAAVALIGLFAFAGEPRRASPPATWRSRCWTPWPSPPPWSGPRGRCWPSTAAWAEANGATVALPKGKSAQALYMAFAQARRGPSGTRHRRHRRARDRGADRPAGEGRFLVRDAPEAVLPCRPPPSRRTYVAATPARAGPWRRARRSARR